MSETAETIRVLIADDHAIVRRGLRTLINSEPGMEVVGEAADGIEATALAKALEPDVILMDMVMPRQGGLEAIQTIKARDPGARILVLTSFAEDAQIFPAIKAGALGYLLKDSSPHQLLAAIHDVNRGESSLHPSIAVKLLREIRRPADLPLSAEPLTERELVILQFVAQGLTNQEIASSLSISKRTVANHVSNILHKLHLANRTQAALYALREGLATLDQA